MFRLDHLRSSKFLQGLEQEELGTLHWEKTSPRTVPTTSPPAAPCSRVAQTVLSRDNSGTPEQGPMGRLNQLSSEQLRACLLLVDEAIEFAGPDSTQVDPPTASWRQSAAPLAV